MSSSVADNYCKVNVLIIINQTLSKCLLVKMAHLHIQILLHSRKIMFTEQRKSHMKPHVKEEKGDP